MDIKNLIDGYDRTLGTADERTDEGSKRSLVKMQIDAKVVAIIIIVSEKNKTNK